MNKRMLCGLLTAAVILGACPTAALAKSKEPTGLDTLNTSLDFRDPATPASGTGYSWDADSLELTLEDFRVKVPTGKLEGSAAIILPEESSIKLVGDDNVIVTNSYDCDAIYCEGELWFEDDGRLEIYVHSLSSNAIFAKQGPVIFYDEVELYVEPARTIIRVDYAKGNHPIVSFQDDAKLSFPLDDADDRSVLITKKAETTAYDNWLDFAEEADEWDDELINLIAVDKAKDDKPVKEEKPSEEEAPAEKPAKPSTYEITIGNTAMKKDGYVTYISDAKPYLSHGYTMLPLRALLNVTGADVDLTWDAATKTVSVKQKTDSQYFKNAVIPVGETYFICSSDRTALSTPAELTEGRVFVSLRDWMNILSALDMPASDLSWDSKTKTVTFVK